MEPVALGVLALATAGAAAMAWARRASDGRDVHASPGGGPPPPAAVLERTWLHAALDALGDGVLVVDPQGEVVLRNQAGRRYEAARHSDALVEDVVQSLVADALRGTPAEREISLFGPPERTLLLRAEPIRDDAGSVVAAVAIVRDVTEARRVDRIRRDFVAAVSHELKTPIGALAVLAEAMRESGEPEVVLQLAARIGSEAERLGRIVEDLLDLSIVEAQERPRREPVPVRLVVEEAHELVREAAAAAGVPIEVAPVHDGLVVGCDRRQVVSAVRNLLENAVKYSEPGAPVELSVRRAGDRAVITVRDHGIGIPRRDLERIFERFYRVDRARSRQTGGTGLGLSIVRHVAAAHGGDVRAESVEGEGSVFELSLPCENPDARLSAAS
jgi:two-component system sensor histidine kinase SenX3